ncbi:MAG TPA: hypothetical protein PLB01_12800 [Thermoanaerobaculia bacterium]|nr:hypothetical protein [Thermoanaerobaculia bacterium]
MASLVLFLLLLAEPVTASGPTMSAGPAGDSRTIVGEIVWVDVPSRLVLIRESVKTTKVKGQPPARQTIAVSVAPDVAVTRGAKAVPLEDLKPKDHVTARYLATAAGAQALSFRVADAAPRPLASAPAAADGSAHAGGN